MAVDSPRRRWPNLFIVGAGRAGTTSLWHYLGRHPDIFMAEIKEPYFFTEELPTFQPAVTTEDEYLRLFAGARGARWIGEATPTYLRDPKAPGKIHAVSPEARILVLVRDPIDRAWSSYWHARRYGVEKRPFDEALPDRSLTPESPSFYIRGSLYVEGLERYRAFFGDQVRVLVFEELFADVPGGMRSLFEWLDVAPGPAADLVPLVLNAYSRPRNRAATRFYSGRAVRFLAKRAIPVSLHHRLARLALVHDEKPPVPAHLRERLAGVFAADVRALEEILGRRLPWPLER